MINANIVKKANIATNVSQRLFNMANISRERGNRIQAMLGYKMALIVKPDFSKALIHVGNLYYEQKKYEKAINFFTRAKNTSEYVSAALEAIGDAQFMKGDYAAAVSNYESVLPFTGSQAIWVRIMNACEKGNFKEKADAAQLVLNVYQ